MPTKKPLRRSKTRLRHADNVQAERLLLTALCQQTLSPPLREEVMRRLGAHKFGHADHQLLFWALSQLPPREPALVRELLATRLTLLGFPDFDLDLLFDSPPPADVDISALLDQF